MPLNQGLYIFLQRHPYKNSSKNFLSEKTIGGETIISNQIKNQLFAEDKCFCELFHSEEYFQSCLMTATYLNFFENKNFKIEKTALL